MSDLVYQSLSSPVAKWQPDIIGGGIGPGGGGGAGAGSVWGAFFNASHMGFRTSIDAANAWAQWTGRPVVASSLYKANPVPADVSADSTLLSYINLGAFMYLQLKPAFNPPSSSDLALIDSYLGSAKAAGLNAAVAIWGEPSFAGGGMTPTLFKAAIDFYGPTIRSHFPLVFWNSAFAVQTNSEGDYFYSGHFDAVVTDFYGQHYIADATTLAQVAALADGDSIPFGISEHNAALAGRGNFLTGDNATFDTSFGTFTGAGNCSTPWDNTVHNTVFPNSSGGSLKILCQGGDALFAHCAAANILTQGMPISPGQQAYTRFYIRNDGTPRVIHAGAGFYNSSGTSLGSVFDVASITDTGAFLIVEGNVTAPSTSAFCRGMGEILATANGEMHHVTDFMLSNDATGLSNANVAAFFDYVNTFMTARLTAGKENYPALLFNSDSQNAPSPNTNAIRSSSDIRIAMFVNEYDGNNAGGGGGGGGGGGSTFARYGATVGSNQTDSQITTWINTMGGGRKLGIFHFFSQAGIPGSVGASAFSGAVAANRRIYVDYELAHDGSQSAAFDTWLGQCQAAGLDMHITMYHNPAKKGFATPSAFWTSLSKYVPIIQKHGFKFIYDMAGFNAIKTGNLSPWYPGNAVKTDAIALEFYAPDYVSSGIRLDSAAAFADSVNLPFGLCEFGAQFAGAGGTDTNVSEADGITFFNYLKTFFAGRIAAGKLQYDMQAWNTINSGSGQTPGYQIQNQPSTWVAIYRQICDQTINAPAAF